MTVVRPRLPAAFPYLGGKWRLAPRIIAAMPPHRCYVEVFGGSAAVLFAKERSHIECINDVEEDVVNFFRCLQEEATTRQLMARLIFTPYARAEYERFCEMTAPADPVLRAWRFYSMARQMFGGFRPANNGRQFAASTRGRWRRSISDKCQCGDANTLHYQIDELDRFTERLRGVYIEKKDFVYILQRWDSPETLFYLDPPYVGIEGYYNNGDFGAVRHVELANLLQRIQGKAMVSYYPHPSIDDLYPAERWTRITFHGTKNAQKAQRGVPKEKTTELLLCNFKPEIAA